MRNIIQQKKGGFTLIELLVVVSVISLLSTILLAFTNAAKAKGSDAATIQQVHEVQNTFQVVQTSAPLPSTGDITNYYCLGKSSSENCTFWGLNLTGNNTVKTALNSSGLTSPPTVNNVVIDNLAYSGYVYKCKAIDSNGNCQPAVYWAQSNNTPCTVGMQVLSGAGGIVCGEDAGGGSVNNVETANPIQFDFSVSNPGDLTDSTSPIFIPITFTTISGAPQYVAYSPLRSQGTQAVFYQTRYVGNNSRCLANPTCTITLEVWTYSSDLAYANTGVRASLSHGPYPISLFMLQSSGLVTGSYYSANHTVNFNILGSP